MKKGKNITCISLAFFLMLAMPVHAHEDEKNKDSVIQSGDELHTLSNSTKEKNADTIFARFEAFPNLHPMVVHFPVVLLLLAVLSQLFGLFIFRLQLSWVTLSLLLGGFIGALLAEQVFHPHTEGLNESAAGVLEMHEYYASWTTWLAAIALFIKLITHFWLNRKTWAEIIVLLVIAGAALSVGLTGHLGSQLIYIEGVGAKGKYIEQHE